MAGTTKWPGRCENSPGPGHQEGPLMPEEKVPPTPLRQPWPAVTTIMMNLDSAHATAVIDPIDGECTVSIGTVDHRILLGDDPAVLLVLLEDAAAQIRAAEASR